MRRIGAPFLFFCLSNRQGFVPGEEVELVGDLPTPPHRPFKVYLVSHDSLGMRTVSEEVHSSTKQQVCRGAQAASWPQSLRKDCIAHRTVDKKRVPVASLVIVRNGPNLTSRTMLLRSQGPRSRGLAKRACLA